MKMTDVSAVKYGIEIPFETNKAVDILDRKGNSALLNCSYENPKPLIFYFGMFHYLFRLFANDILFPLLDN